MLLDGDADTEMLSPLKVTVESQVLQQFMKHRGAVYLLNLANGMQKQTMFTALPYAIDLP